MKVADKPLRETTVLARHLRSLGAARLSLVPAIRVDIRLIALNLALGFFHFLLLTPREPNLEPMHSIGGRRGRSRAPNEPKNR